MKKSMCSSCRWKGSWEDVLVAPNPFDEKESISGCPKCLGAETMLPLCDEEGCWKEVSCGAPTKDGYKWTCGEHAPKEEEGK